MKNEYQKPQIEVVEIELEDTLLQNSTVDYGLSDVEYGGSAW